MAKKMQCGMCGTINQVQVLYSCDECGTTLGKLAKLNYKLSFFNPVNRKEQTMNFCSASCIVRGAVKLEKIEESWKR